MLDLERGTFEGIDVMKARETDETFGKRLAVARQRRGLTQAELGKLVDVSQRVVAYYEADGSQLPGALLAGLASRVKVTTDQLLGLKPATDKPSPKTARLLKRLRKIEELPATDQRTVQELLDALHAAHGRAARARAAS